MAPDVVVHPGSKQHPSRNLGDSMGSDASLSVLD